MKKILLILSLTAVGFLSQACARDYLSIRELPSDVARTATQRTQDTWLIFDFNGIETLYWCTPTH